MKSKLWLTLTVLLFLVVNTSYFWMGKFGSLALPVFIILILVFLVLCFALLQQFYFLIKDNFKDRNKNLTIGLMCTLLVLTFFKPKGIINFESFESKAVLIAQREGVANCMTILKLKENNRFKERVVCFGISEVTGNYRIKNDTIFFNDIVHGLEEDDFFEFAVIKPSKGFNDANHFEMIRYKNKQDTVGDFLYVIKNELNKN
ncbi:hypothetical protein [Flavobacterium capsici]|uniref:Uncharacterized protein n=1 Tax=Flavobacterium capsici TaxID=3075618 RepID=A0AA96F2C5_9FLAO|nr:MULTISPECIES: hypothetical protein [unclassified Flavobacterium]WNM20323.1 hypothetical protein RN608_06495 [Flavobacterium sp. PMR2A8]WNM21713.1 hypothetical protein RN605_13665 [Flavobacterium sp. PMTSA4]